MVIDLVFLEVREALHRQPRLLDEMRDTLDHIPILTTLPLGPDQGPEGRWSIKPDSKAEENFVDQLTTGISRIRAFLFQ